MTVTDRGSFLFPRVISYFDQKADAQFWEEHWRGSDRIPAFRGGRLGHLEGPFRSFLSVRRTVLEAGCGQGQLVAGLHARDYDVIGVDFAEITLRGTAKAVPDLKLVAGDVTRLPFEDESLGAYISLGVIEHDQSGPERFIEEAKRVLAPDGVAIFTVPYANLFRRVKYGWRGAVGPRDGDFYQYYYHDAVIRGYLARYGFEVVHFDRYNPSITLTRDFWENRLTTSGAFRNWVNASPAMQRVFSHNALYVCRFKSFLDKAPKDALSHFRYDDDAPVVHGLDAAKRSLSGEIRDRVFVTLDAGDDLVRLATDLVADPERSRGRVYCVDVATDSRPLTTTADLKVHYRLPDNDGATYFLEIIATPQNKDVGKQVHRTNAGGQPRLVLNALGNQPTAQVDSFDRKTYPRLHSILDSAAARTVSIASHFRRPAFRDVLAAAGISEGAGDTDAVVIFADGDRTVEQAMREASDCAAPRALVVCRARARGSWRPHASAGDFCRPAGALPVLSHLAAGPFSLRRWLRRLPGLKARRYPEDHYSPAGELIIFDLSKGGDATAKASG
jgi:SAM-dependent methyltransferase